MKDQSRQQPPYETSKSPRSASRLAIGGAVLLLGGLSLFGISTLGGNVSQQGDELPEGADQAAMLAPLPGGRPSDPALPETLDAVDGSQNRSVGRPSSSAEFVELSELSKEALKEVRKREQRFEQASQLAEVPDERSPADAELIEELERHLEQGSFDDAQLEMELIRAQGSLQMLRAFNEAAKDR